MKLAIPKCPECGSIARGTVDKVVAEIQMDDDELDLEEVGQETEFDYNGQTDLNNQETITNHAGESLVICEKGHEWYTPIEEE